MRLLDLELGSQIVPRFYIYTGDGSKNPNRQWSSIGQILYKKSICSGAPLLTLLGELTALPRRIAVGEGARTPSPSTPLRFSYENSSANEYQGKLRR